jgi:lipopolysaccharide export system protein LptA
MIRRFRLVLPCFLIALCMPAAAAEEPVPDTVVQSQSCEITSTDTQTLSVFTGNVTVTGNNIRITCDRLDVVSLRSGGRQDTIGKQERFKSLVATGRVRIVQGDREAACEHAEVLPGEDRITLTGQPVVIDHGNNSTATGEPLVLWRTQRRITGKNIRITLPPLKDLGFDKSQPPPVPAEAPGKLP